MKKEYEEYFCDECKEKCKKLGELEEPYLLVKETTYNHEHHFCSYKCLTKWASRFA